MIFKQLFDKTSSTYTYLISSGKNREALIIDPVLENTDKYLDILNNLNLKLVKVLDTHIHADHITGMGKLQEKTSCETVMGEKTPIEIISIKLKDGEELNIDGIKLKALYTPGHTIESYSFTINNKIFTGDSLLIGGTGRTDFQNGCPYMAYNSLFEVILKLPNNTQVFPAHDYNGNLSSTIEVEKKMNPRLQVNNADEYAEIMNNLNLPSPKLMDIAIPRNLRMGKL